ncbi:MAG: helix-turn-helix domain-containing protein, partial [Jiangellaceae bacterium]
PPAPLVFDATANKEPVAPSPTDIRDWWVHIPEPTAQPAPLVQRLPREIRQRTGWSQRKLAKALGSTHPTVRALEEGRSAARSKDLFDRLLDVHDVVERAFMLAGRDVKESDRLLTTPPADDRASALDLLESRQPAEAYLAALDVLRPRRQTAMMRGMWPARAGEATTALSETDRV